MHLWESTLLLPGPIITCIWTQSTQVLIFYFFFFFLMDDESRTISAVQLRKAFDLQPSQPSAMVTSQHRENPWHDNHETCASHLRESALHAAKHLSGGIKRVSCCILRQPCQNAYKPLSLGKEDFIFSAKLYVFSPNWSPRSVPTESTQHTPTL